jgi:hypothetical protein
MVIYSSSFESRASVPIAADKLLLLHIHGTELVDLISISTILLPEMICDNHAAPHDLQFSASKRVLSAFLDEHQCGTSLTSFQCKVLIEPLRENTDLNDMFVRFEIAVWRDRSKYN